jgi:hypothetical protein
MHDILIILIMELQDLYNRVYEPIYFACSETTNDAHRIQMTMIYYIFMVIVNYIIIVKTSLMMQKTLK